MSFILTGFLITILAGYVPDLEVGLIDDREAEERLREVGGDAHTAASINNSLKTL